MGTCAADYIACEYEGGMKGTGVETEIHGKNTGVAETGKQKRGDRQRAGIQEYTSGE